jgi:hypothetical protein
VAIGVKIFRIFKAVQNMWHSWSVHMVEVDLDRIDLGFEEKELSELNVFGGGKDQLP